MTKLFTLFFCCFFLIKTASAQSENANAIKSSFAKYNEAISAQNGNEAAKYLDNNTVAYYDKMISFIKTADSAKVAQLPLLDKLTVLTLRNKLTKDEIKSFDGKSLLAYSFTSGMSKASGFDLGEITINANQAKAQILVANKNSNEYVQFNREDGLWKIDLTSLFPLTEKSIKGMIQNNFAGDENKFCLMVANGMGGTDANKNLWKPIN